MNLSHIRWPVVRATEILRTGISSRTYMARTKPENISTEDEYLKNVPEAELESIIAAIPSCKEISKEMLILTAIRTETIGL